MIVEPNALNWTYRRRIAAFTAEHRLATMSGDTGFAEAGGLMSYGTSLPDHALHAAALVDKVLKGAKPADLPVEQPTKMAPQGPMYDNLMRRDPRDGHTIIPDLAYRWEISPDGKTYTFFLRQGVKFHDGADFTAEDVKATYSRIIWPPKGVSIPRTPLFSAVSQIDIRDAYTIAFKLSAPRPKSFML